MEGIEWLIGAFKEFRENAIDHRKLMEGKINDMQKDVSDIKIQVKMTNGRVNKHDLEIEEIADDFTEHKEKGIKTDSYLNLLYIIIGMVGGGLVTFMLENLFKK